MLFRLILAELLKLRRSLALLLCLAAPTCVAVLVALIILGQERVGSVENMAISGAALWSFGMLPLAVVALSVLMAQSEHAPRTWDHLLVFPGARTGIPLAKAVVTYALVAAMAGLLALELWAGAWLVERLRPEVTGALDFALLARTLALMTAASLLVAMLQLWVALRFKSFVPPLLFGIAGTFVAVGATGAQQGIYFPWLMAVNVLAQEPGRQGLALWFGFGGGLVALAAMTLHLSRREA